MVTIYIKSVKLFNKFFKKKRKKIEKKFFLVMVFKSYKSRKTALKTFNVRNKEIFIDRGRSHESWRRSVWKRKKRRLMKSVSRSVNIRLWSTCRTVLDFVNLKGSHAAFENEMHWSRSFKCKFNVREVARVCISLLRKAESRSKDAGSQ